MSLQAGMWIREKSRQGRQYADESQSENGRRVEGGEVRSEDKDEAREDKNHLPLPGGHSASRRMEQCRWPFLAIAERNSALATAVHNGFFYVA